MSLPVSVLHGGSSRKLLGLNFIHEHPAEQIHHRSSWLRLFSSAADGSTALCDREEEVSLEEGEADGGRLRSCRPSQRDQPDGQMWKIVLIV